uniref:DNA methylase N-4/N-6 domain-containing protein n=1 Tax=viral metagenome TaxID=1070528 RepID=A0A6C0F4G3_9ZZZZ
MLFLTNDKLLSLFKSNGTHKPTVKIGQRIVPLVEYMKTKDKLTAADVKLLFENVHNRNEYLTRFYETSLKIPDSLAITDAPMKNKQMNNNALVKYKNVIRNMFYKEILKDTKSGMDNNPTFFDVIEDLYVRNIIDYKILTPSAVHYMKNGRLGSVFSSFYFRASIMNPYLVYSLNQSVLRGTRIFTPTLGWCSYCYGFLECPGVVEYVGTDVITSVCKKTTQFASEYYPNKSVKIYNSPSESLLASKFVDQYKNHFDVVFFSPPYYRLEMYPGTNQSTTKYKTYEEWLAGYWEKTIQLCHQVLSPGGKLCYILSGYGSNNEFNLLKDMNMVTMKYFKLKSQQPMFNKNVHVTEHRETGETIMIFIK